MNNQLLPVLISGTSHPQFAKELASQLGLNLAKISIETFPDGEISVQILDNVRGRDVYVIQSVARRPNHYLMELLIIIDALKRASARSIVAVIPYYGYSRQDRKDKPRVPITAKLVADLLAKAGATRLLTMDLHAGQIQGFFDIPADNLYARPKIAQAVMALNLKDFVVTAPDLGAIKQARAYANQLGAEVTVIDKRRVSIEKVEVFAIIGEVSGKNVLIVDDMVSTGGTIISAAYALKKAGAGRIFAAFTHGLLVGDAIAKLEESPIEKVFVSNTVPPPLNGKMESSKLEIVSVVPLFAEAIARIGSADSISSLFN